MARPHLVFLLADQLRFDVLGAYGDQQCATPALDRLAERSVVFDRHFTVSPQCGPARTSLLTGLHPQRHGAVINGWLPAERSHGMMRPGLELLPQKLADAGYKVTHVGVQHVRSDPDLPRLMPGVRFVGPTSAAEHLNSLRDRGLTLPDTRSLRDPIIDFEKGKKTVFTSTSPRPAIFPLREDLYFDHELSRSMAEAVDQHASNGRETPMALLGMFWLPHPPLWAPRQYATMIDPADVKLPGTVGKWCYGMSPMQLANVPGQLGAHLSDEQWRAAWAVYLGMVALLDRCVARVLEALDRAGLTDDTLIVFSSDHGEMLGSHKLFGKMCMYEEATRVPLMMKLPGQHRSRRVLELTDHLELAATLLDFAAPGGSLRGSEARSLWSIAEGTPSVEQRSHVFASYDGNGGRGFRQRMVRSTTHKLIWNVGEDVELYDLVEDPRETHNLVGNGGYADREAQKELTAVLNGWMDRMGDEVARIA